MAMGFLAAVACVASFADVARAAAAGGVGCVSSDGKIDGRGSQGQSLLQQALWNGFGSDVCGATPGSPADEAADDMGVYDYGSATSGGFADSGQGQEAANCRSDAYAASDFPYTEFQLGELDGDAGNALLQASDGDVGGGCDVPTAPFSPSGGTFPAAGDLTEPMMSFPIAGYAVAIVANLTAADCDGQPPGSLDLDQAQVDEIWWGEVSNWSSASLAQGSDAWLANCDVPITRVVRSDDAGTTATLQRYVGQGSEYAYDLYPQGSCGVVGSTCTILNGITNIACTTSPSGPSPSLDCIPANACEPTGECDTENGYLLRLCYANNLGYGSPSGPALPPYGGWPCGTDVVGADGDAALLSLLADTPGGVGYADLAAEDQFVGQTHDQFVTASVENGTQTAYVPPQAADTANCDFSILTLPGFTWSDAIGLNSEDNWAVDNAQVNGQAYGSIDHENATNLGSRYPICGLSFDFVYTGLSAGSSSAITQLSPDQRRTLYAFFTYVFSSSAQQKISNANYAVLPNLWLRSLQNGFQQGF